MPKQVKIPTHANPKANDFDTFSAKRGRPMLFQISDPVFQRPLYPVLLALHVNPQTLSEKMLKSKNVVMTYGGFVEFIWPDDLDSLSADMTTGAFISPRTGLTAASPNSLDRGRQGTIAWERQEDLLDLFRMNGAVYNSIGQPMLRGRVMCMYDRGIFAGFFESFNVVESDENAFSFQINWEFKVEQTIYRYPQSQSDFDRNGTIDKNSFPIDPFIVPSSDQTFQTGINNGQFQSINPSPVSEIDTASVVVDNTTVPDNIA